MHALCFVFGLLSANVLCWRAVHGNLVNIQSVEDVVRPREHMERLRRDELPTIRIETAIIVDADFIQHLQQTGHTTEEEMTEIIKLKMNGAQAEFGKADVFGYHIYIDIKLIEFWYTNPEWYKPTSVLNSVLYSFCFGAEQQGLYKTYDFLHLFTGVEKPDVSGKAYTGKICDPKRKCALSSQTRVTEYVITTHELGHSLGMSHDIDVGCPSPDDGIMGSKTSGWSTCSINSTQELLRGSTVGCLFEINTESSIVLTLTAEWPGMTYTDDEICELHHGPGYVFRPFPYIAWGECALHSCWNMSTSSVEDGRSYNHYFPTDGRYCGYRQVCSSEIVSGSYRCISWAETGLHVTLFEEVEGGWSSWGEWSSCGRTCGKGVRYRQRTCDDPKPRHSPSCNGSRYDAVLCNTQPCEFDESKEGSLIRQRAGEVCSILQTSAWYGSRTDNYRTTGDRYHYQYDGQCEVRCDTTDDFKAPSFQRYGLMPDGTPCSPESETLVEKYKLPRRSGYTYHCVQGQCLRFDCEGATSGEITNDNCGVCGGGGTTCDVTQSVFNTTLTNYETQTIVQLPPGAFLIQAYFVYGEMDSYLMELWSADMRPIIAPFEPESEIYSTEETPVTLDGTRWHYDYAVQYLFADGIINSSVTIKVIGFGNTENKGIHFSYSTPKDTGVAVGENCTNTFCRDTHAVCDKESVCNCRPGFRYNTTLCTDIDECLGQGHNCVSGGECSNTAGSFICRCGDGYTGDGYMTCEDIDECLSQSHNCVDVTSGGECSNTAGSFICRCGDGYTGDGYTSCEDIDECLGQGHSCVDVTSGGECSNTAGSFFCRCGDGYTGDGYTICEDIDECTDAQLNACVSRDQGGHCLNSAGSYECVCTDGYTGNGTESCEPPLDAGRIEDLDILTIFTTTYILMIAAVFIHCVFYLLNNRCSPHGRALSAVSMVMCSIILLGEAIFLIDFNQLYIEIDCRVMSVFIHISCIGYFMMAWIETFTVYVFISQRENPRCATWTGILLSIGITAITITVLAVVTDREGFVLQEGCWYDMQHIVFKATCVLVGTTVAGVCVFVIVLHSKITVDSKLSTVRSRARLLRSVVRRIMCCAPCHAAVWVVRAVSVNYQTWWIPLSLVLLNIEGLVFLISRLYTFRHKVCPSTILNPKIRDVDHPDAPNVTAEDTVGDHSAIDDSTDRADTADVHITVEGVPIFSSLTDETNISHL